MEGVVPAEPSLADDQTMALPLVPRLFAASTWTAAVFVAILLGVLDGALGALVDNDSSGPDRSSTKPMSECSAASRAWSWLICGILIGTVAAHAPCSPVSAAGDGGRNGSNGGFAKFRLTTNAKALLWLVAGAAIAAVALTPALAMHWAHHQRHDSNSHVAAVSPIQKQSRAPTSRNRPVALSPELSDRRPSRVDEGAPGAPIRRQNSDSSSSDATGCQPPGLPLTSARPGSHAFRLGQPSSQLREMRRLVFGEGDVPPQKFLQKCATGPLDAVFLWTNGSDPKIADGSKSSSNRVREWDELYYALKLFRANAVNVGRVLVVAPAGVRPRYMAELKDWIEFVDVETFLPEPLANTRNSFTIEWHLEELKAQQKLTDPLIALNDDWLVVGRFDLVAHANEFKWCQEKWGSNWGYGNPATGKDPFVESIATVNRAFRSVSAKYVPNNISPHLPVVVRSRTVEIVQRHFKHEQTNFDSIKRENQNLNFAYMLAQVEYNLLGATYKTCAEDYGFVSMNGPLAKLKAELCQSRKGRKGKRFICINDDIAAQYLGTGKQMAEFKSTITDYLESLVAGRGC